MTTALMVFLDTSFGLKINGSLSILTIDLQFKSIQQKLKLFTLEDLHPVLGGYLYWKKHLPSLLETMRELNGVLVPKV